MWQYPSIIVAFGILFSVFFSSILIAKPCKSRANWYLAGVVLSTGLSICYELLFPTGLHRLLPHLVKIYIPSQFLIGPLLFLYVSVLIEPDFRFEKLKLLHFLPCCLSILYLLPFFLESAEAKISFVETTVSPTLPSRLEEWIIWLGLQASLWTYSMLSLRKCRQYGHLIKETVSDTSRFALDWLIVFLISVLVILVAFLAIDAFMFAGVPLVAFNPFISISMTCGIVYLGWRGLLRFEYILPAVDEKGPPPPAKERNAQEYAGLFDQVLAATRGAALFRSPELTLPELA